MTQQQVAEEMGVAQQTVSDLESITENKPDNIRIKSGNLPPTPKPSYGTSKTHTIARLKRDGHKDLAQQVEAGQLPATHQLSYAGFYLRESIFSKVKTTCFQYFQPLPCGSAR